MTFRNPSLKLLNNILTDNLTTAIITKLKESEKLELKESFKDNALKTLCAFANTKGGSLFVGVKDDSTLIHKWFNSPTLWVGKSKRLKSDRYLVGSAPR